MSNSSTSSDRSRALLRRYAAALACGDEEAGTEVMRDAVSSGWNIGQIYSRLIIPVQTQADRRGGRSANGSGSRTAAQITLSHVAWLRSELPLQKRHGGYAIVVAVGRREPSLAVSMTSDVLRFDGWTVDIARTVPLRGLLGLLQARKAGLMAIPYTRGGKVETVRRLVQRIQQLSDAPRILVEEGMWGAESRSGAEAKGVRLIADFEEMLRAGRELLSAGGHEEGLAGFLKTLGSRIRARRRSLSLTQQQLAETANLDRTYIVAVERGRQNVTVGAVMRMAEALNLSIDQLFLAPGTGEGGGSIKS